MGPRVSDEQVARAVEATPPIPVGPIEPTWESLEQNYRVPEWFRDGKFGIFLHWGLYSIPAYHNEWYQKYMYGNRGIREWHIENFGPLDEYGYIRFAEQFATNFNADDWAELFKEAGAAYVVPTAEHHDWFSLWTAK